MILAAIAVTVFAVPVHAQLYDGSLTGVVADPSGAVIGGARVTLTDIGKGYKHTTVSDAQGRYLLRLLPPSSYRLSVEATGFRAYSQDRIIVDVNQNVTVDVRLAVGTAAETVQVTGIAPQISAQDATTGQEVNQVFISNLPLIGRELLDLTFLAPGVNPAPGNTYGSLAGEWTANASSPMGDEMLLRMFSWTGPALPDTSRIPAFRFRCIGLLPMLYRNSK